MRYYSGPMEGVTTYLFRAAHHRLFGGCDKYFTPFLSPTPEHHATVRGMRELEPANNAGIPVVPQIMARKPEDFLWAAELCRELGYGEVNLNLGCPSGTVVSKGKGAGFLARPDELDAFFETVFRDPPLPVSVKTRLGLRDPAEFPALLEIFNRYPISELIVHARVREDYYTKPVRPDAFTAALERSRMPLVYNGDLVTEGDCAAFAARFSGVDTVMIGRGIAADPALVRKLRGGPAATKAETVEFVGALRAGYRKTLGDASATQRMKELWYYLLHSFDGGEAYALRMRRVRRPEEYQMLENEIFANLEILPEARGAFQ